MCATYIVAPGPAIAYLETGGRDEMRGKGNTEWGYQNSGLPGLYAETFKEVTEKTSPPQHPHLG